MNWSNEKINVLGVEINNDQEKVMEENMEAILNRTKQVLEQWCHRNISLIGKINIVNTLVASLYVYRLSNTS